jgi:hypothetical protein
MRIHYSKHTSKNEILDDYEKNLHIINTLMEQVENIKVKVKALKSDNQNINKTYQRRYGESINN